MTCLVVGVGHPDRGDDAAGPAVIHALRDLELTGMTLVEWTGDPAGLLDLDGWTGGCVVLVDATTTGAEPGTLRRWDATAEDLTGVRTSAGGTHDLGLPEVIALGRRLGRFPARLIVFGIEGERFDIGAPVSAAVARGIAQATVRIAVDARLALESIGHGTER